MFLTYAGVCLNLAVSVKKNVRNVWERAELVWERDGIV